MGRVATVMGDVEPASLGRVLMHEHLLCDLEHSLKGFVAGLHDKDLAIRELVPFKAAGGGTLVELTPRGVGRDARGLRSIAEATGVNIVAATGYYTEPYYPREVYENTVPELAELMVRDLSEGIDDSGIRAGIIGELGTRRRYITPAEERVFLAAARAQQETGVAITTHTYWGGELALQQVALLLGAGVAEDRIIIGHLGDKRDFEFLRRVADTGVFIQFDHIGKPEYLPDADRAEIVKVMIDHGHLNQILISLDVCFKSHLAHFGGIGYGHLITSFVPDLVRVGVTPDQVNSMLVDNPRRALCGEE